MALHVPPIEVGLRLGEVWVSLLQSFHQHEEKRPRWPTGPRRIGFLEQTWNPAPPRGTPTPCPSRDTVVAQAATRTHRLSRCWWPETQVCHPVRVNLLVCRQKLPSCVSPGRGDREANSQGLLNKGMIPLQGLTLMTLIPPRALPPDSLECWHFNT